MPLSASTSRTRAKLDNGIPDKTNDRDADNFEPFDYEKAKADAEKKRKKGFLKFRDSQQGKDLVALVKQWHSEAKNNRTQEERQWALNLAQYKGRFDLGLIPSVPGIPQHLHGRIGRLPKNQQSQSKINRIRPAIRTEIARLISQKPSASVIPATADDNDLFAAQAGEQAWQSIQDRAKLQVHFNLTAFWTTVAGNGFMKVWWDANAFDKDSHIPGDIKFASPSPFHIFVPDKLEKDIEDQPWVIHAFAKPLGWAQNAFRDQLQGVELRASVARTSDIVEAGTLGVADNGQAEKNAVLVYEAWVKPGVETRLPKGGLITVVNDTLVGFTEGFPYDHGEFPFVKFDAMPSEVFYADSVIVDLASLNYEYNFNRSKIQEAVVKMSSLQIIAPQGSVIPQKMTNETGQVIQYKPGLGKPEPFPLQQIPGHLPQSLDRILLDIEDISGQHQVSKGNAPSGVTAATAISFLQEQDETYFVHTVKSVEWGMEKLGRQSLNLAVQYWDEPRVVKFVGADAMFDAFTLRGSDLSSGTDLRIEGGSALPQSKAARQALLMDLMAQGFIDPQEGLKMLEIGGTQKLMDHLKIDERQAQRENLRLRDLTDEDIEQYEMLWQQQMSMMQMEGVIPSGDASPTGEGAADGFSMDAPPIIPVNTWDNHEVHIEVHNRFRKSQAFDMLSSVIKAQFEEHIQAHEQAMITKSMNDFMAMIPSDGSAPGDMQDSAEELPADMPPEMGGAPTEMGAGAPAPEGGMI